MPWPCGVEGWWMQRLQAAAVAVVAFAVAVLCVHVRAWHLGVSKGIWHVPGCLSMTF